jgi:hypothetical protein
VQEAVSEIESLRDENERLRRRVRELESRPSVGEDEVFLTLDDDRDALRARITQFIEAIDRRLGDADPDSEAASHTDGAASSHGAPRAGDSQSGDSQSGDSQSGDSQNGDSQAGGAEPAIDAPSGSVGASSDDHA